MIGQVCCRMGMTVIHVTHDLNNIFSWSKRILAIKDGRIKMNGTPQEILTSENLYKIFEAEFIFLRHPVTGQQLIFPKLKS